MRICVFAATFLICGCSGKQDRTAETLPLPLSKLSGYENEVFPVANGNAYLVSGIERQLFLLSKDRASRIDGIELHGAEASIYPLPDGGANRTRGCLTEIRVPGGIPLGANAGRPCPLPPSPH